MNNMVLYISVILFSMLVIVICNYFIYLPTYNFDLPYIVTAVVLSTILEIIIDLIFAFIVRRMLPSKWFSANKKYFAGKRERKFYDKIFIKKWKDKVPDLGALSGFRKNKIAKPNDEEYLSRYIVEANYGIFVHVACMIFGFLVIFVYPLKFWHCFGLPVSLVNLVLNLLPIFVLRYNLPKLHKLLAFKNGQK